MLHLHWSAFLTKNCNPQRTRCSPPGPPGPPSPGAIAPAGQQAGRGCGLGDWWRCSGGMASGSPAPWPCLPCATPWRLARQA